MNTRNLSKEKRDQIKAFILKNYKSLSVTTIAKQMGVSHPTILFHMYSMGIKTKGDFRGRMAKMVQADVDMFNVNEKYCWLIG